MLSYTYSLKKIDLKDILNWSSQYCSFTHLIFVSDQDFSPISSQAFRNLLVRLSSKENIFQEYNCFAYLSRTLCYLVFYSYYLLNLCNGFFKLIILCQCKSQIYVFLKSILYKDFIKTTDHRPTDHLPPTNRPVVITYVKTEHQAPNMFCILR